MAEAAVIGHVGHGIAVVDDHVEIGERAEQGAVEQRLAALPAAEQGGLDAGAEYGLGDRIHGAVRSKRGFTLAQCFCAHAAKFN